MQVDHQPIEILNRCVIQLQTGCITVSEFVTKVTAVCGSNRALYESIINHQLTVSQRQLEDY